MSRYFKIRRDCDGLFSTGGLFPTFVKDGKVWPQLRHLKVSITGVWKHYQHVHRPSTALTEPKPFVYADCTVVEFVLHPIAEVSVADVDMLKKK